MKKYWPWIAMIPLLLAGCHTERLYDGTYPTTPTRWPDDVATCGITVSVFPRWRKVITWTNYPSLNGYQDVGGGGCGGRANNRRVMERVVEMQQGKTIYMGQMNMDHGSGGWNDYAVFYGLRLGTTDYFKDETQYIDPNYRYFAAKTATLPDTWTFNKALGKPTSVVINGLKWRHFMLYEFDSLYPDPSKPGIPVNQRASGARLFPPPTIHTTHPAALDFVAEVYTLQVDNTHEMKVWGIYMRPVVQDAHWLKARRAMLRKLVNAVTVRSLTPPQITQLRTLAAVQQNCYAGSVEACRKGGLRTEYASQ